MAWSDIPVYAPTNLIPSAWANQLFQNEVHLDNRSGHDAPAPNLFLVSGAAPSLVNGWRALQAGDFALGLIPDAAMANPKVTKAGDIMTGDLTVSRQSIGQPTVGYLWLGQTGSLVYIGYNGTSIALVGARVYIPGILQTDSILQAPGAAIGAQGVSVSGTGGVNVVGGGPIQGGSKAVGGNIQVIGIEVGVHGILSDAQISAPNLAATGGGGIAVSGGGSVVVTGGGGVNAAGGPFSGGDRTNGTISVLGLLVGPNGFSNQGPIYVGNPTPSVVIDAARNVTAASYNGGSTVAGDAAVLGLNVGTHGIATAAQVASSLAAGSPFTAVSPAVCTGVNADMTDGFHASVFAGPSRIPVTDATGKLDAWITPAVAGATVPSGAIVAFDTAAHLTAAGSGWTPHTAADGRLLVGTGTTFSQAFTQGSSYGASWAHDHTTPAHSHSGASLSISGSTGAASGSGNQANVVTPNPANATQGHTHDQGNLDVAGSTANDGASTSGPTTWLPPMLGVVWGRKL